MIDLSESGQNILHRVKCLILLTSMWILIISTVVIFPFIPGF